MTNTIGSMQYNNALNEATEEELLTDTIIHKFEKLERPTDEVAIQSILADLKSLKLKSRKKTLINNIVLE